MKNSITKILTFTFVLILSGCAATYKPINPPSLNYSAHDLVDEISISYQYDVLQYKTNKKYARKEQKRNLKLIAVKITNNSDSAITIGNNAFFYAGENKITPLEPQIIKKELGQIVPGYIPYILLSLIRYVETQNGVETKSVPIGLAIGPPIMIGNMAVAGSANRKFYLELLDYNINQRIINSGETVYGLVGFKDFNYAPLRIEMTK